MKRKTIFIAAALLVLSTLACRLFAGEVQPLAAEAPTGAPPLPPPASSGGDACIVGAWEMKDFEQYLAAVIPPEITSTGELTYDGTTGRATYTFTGNGQASIQAEAFTVQYKMSMGALNLPMEIILDGSGSANYAASGSRLLFSNVDSANLLMSINLGGAPMMPATPVTGLFPDGDTDSAVAFTCEGNTLTLTMPAANSAPVVLERTSP